MWSGLFLIDLRKKLLPRRRKCDMKGLLVLLLLVLLLILLLLLLLLLLYICIRFGTYKDIFPNPKP